jgi:hypothetical protein
MEAKVSNSNLPEHALAAELSLAARIRVQNAESLNQDEDEHCLLVLQTYET